MAQDNLLPPVSDDVHSFLLEDELLLFSEHSRAIYRLNTSAALIWCCFEEGLDQQSISAELSKTYELSAAEAETVISTALSEWETLGLVGQGNKHSTPPHRSSVRNTRHSCDHRPCCQGKRGSVSARAPLQAARVCFQCLSTRIRPGACCTFCFFPPGSLQRQAR